SVNPSFDSGDVQLAGSRAVPSLTPGALNLGTTAITIPAGTPAGFYYVIAVADADGVVTEIQENNNTRGMIIQVVAGSYSQRAGGSRRIGCDNALAVRALDTGRSPTAGLLAGMVFTLAAVSADSYYLTRQISRLRALQTDLADRSRRDSLQLLRIQNDLNTLGLAMRDMLDSSEPYPLTAWSGQFRRVRLDLED